MFNLLSGKGAEHRNKDIIHERDIDFNAYFRQNAKLVKMAHGHLFLCAKHPKIGSGIGQPEHKTSGADAPLEIYLMWPVTKRK
jgi:hypothetical protein